MKFKVKFCIRIFKKANGTKLFLLSITLLYEI